MTNSHPMLEAISVSVSLPKVPATPYGWMGITLNNNGQTGTIHNWAWDETGEPISVGAIPEPKTTLILIAAAMSALILRRPAFHLYGQ